MGMFPGLVFFPKEEKEWEVPNNSFMNHPFKSSAEKTAGFHGEGFRTEVLHHFRPGLHVLVVPILVLSVFPVVVPFYPHLAGAGTGQRDVEVISAALQRGAAESLLP